MMLMWCRSNLKSVRLSKRSNTRICVSESSVVESCSRLNFTSPYKIRSRRMTNLPQRYTPQVPCFLFQFSLTWDQALQLGTRVACIPRLHLLLPLSFSSFESQSLHPRSCPTGEFSLCTCWVFGRYSRFFHDGSVHCPGDNPRLCDHQAKPPGHTGIFTRLLGREEGGVYCFACKTVPIFIHNSP